MELPIACAGLYRLEAVNTSGRLLEQRVVTLPQGMQRVMLPSVIMQSQGIAFLRVSGPGGTWSARLVHGKGSISSGASTGVASGIAARATATDAIIVSAPGFVSQTVTLPSDSVARQNITAMLVRDPLSPNFSPLPGPFSTPLSMTMFSGVTNGIIRYTTDGTVPTTLSAGYSAPLSISTDTFFRAQVFRSGVAQGVIVDAVYTKSMGIQPVAGTYQGFVHATVTNLKGDERYSLDGSIPTASSPLWNGQLGLDIDQDAFLVVRSFKPRTYPETVEYTVQDTSLTPRGTGSWFFDTTIVTLTNMWPDAEIHYTTDSATPTRNSPLYTKPFGVWKTCVVKAIAYRQGFASSVASIPFNLVTPTPAPVFDTSIAAGFTDSVLVALYGVKNVSIRYTIDGAVPNGNSPIYSGPFYLKKTATVKAVSGTRNLSAVTSLTYTLDGTPRVLPDSGTLANQTSVAVTIKSISPEVRYTLDGSDPTELSIGYTGPFTLASFPVTLNARAFWAGAAPSGITTVTYSQTADGIVSTSNNSRKAEILIPNLLLDQRDNNVYKTVAIGGNLWMKEDSRYNDGSQQGLYFGGSAGSACPDGWKLPTSADWGALFSITSNPISYISKSAKGTDSLDFSAALNGFSLDVKTAVVLDVGSISKWWGSDARRSDAGITQQYAISLQYPVLNTPSVAAWYEDVNWIFTPHSYSVRCVKDLAR